MRIRLTKLDPTADANVVENLEEPFDLGIGEAERKAKVVLCETAGFGEHLLELFSVFALLIREGFLKKLLVLFRFVSVGRVAITEMCSEKDGVFLKKREEHLALPFSNQEGVLRLVALDELHVVLLG